MINNLIFKKKNKFFLYLIPFLLGAITSFSLPPYSIFFLNFITLSFLFIFLVENFAKGKWISFIIGWSFGFGYFISSLYWITNSLTFEEAFSPLIPFALILIPLFIGLFYGLITLLASFINLKKNFTSILIFSTLFSLIEYLRGFIFGGFPWNLLVYSLTEYLELIQILSIIGTYSLNLICINFFLLPVIIFSKFKNKTKLSILIAAVLIIIVNFIYGKTTINKFEKLEEKNLNYKIQVISPSIKIDRFFKNENTENFILELVKIAEPKYSDKTIFIFPEGILSKIYLQDLKKYSKIFSNNFSVNHKIILGINSIENSNIYNSMVILDNNLNILEKYNKNKLVLFGEYLPFESFFNKFGLKKITQGYQSFTSDDQRSIIKIDNLKFIPLICYEIIYSGKININSEYFDFILNISEDGWFGDSVGPIQHFSHSIFRSIEEGKYLVRSTNNGISAFLNSKGQIIDKTVTKGFIKLKTFKKVKKSIFSSYGNKIFFYFLLFYISLIAFLKLRENK